ncbi:hypothetical protein Bca52824_006888 [Brassica carinata]|uniref:Cytochrome b-c1 complex subunit Rieske, mitochondrial n=1 Tax=Brassica carinata TaxID=52824 RepID=A0A8X8B6G6_BRACI|nr:hypothetical protein Bca52824_006888 [Brassica carinata]
MLRVAGRRLLSVQQRSSTATSVVLARDYAIISNGGDSSFTHRSVPSSDLSSFNSYHRSLIRDSSYPIFCGWKTCMRKMDVFSICGHIMLTGLEDVLALASLEVDLGSIEPGTTVTVKWRGKPVFIKRRTKDDIKLANSL